MGDRRDTMAGRRCSSEAGGECVKFGYPCLGVFAQALCACWRTGGGCTCPLRGVSQPRARAHACVDVAINLYIHNLVSQLFICFGDCSSPSIWRVYGSKRAFSSTLTHPGCPGNQTCLPWAKAGGGCLPPSLPPSGRPVQLWLQADRYRQLQPNAENLRSCYPPVWVGRAATTVGRNTDVARVTAAP